MLLLLITFLPTWLEKANELRDQWIGKTRQLPVVAFRTSFTSALKKKYAIVIKISKA